jgi:hypothetical protein
LRRFAAHALKALAFLVAPLFVGMLAATIKGWAGLAGNLRLAAGWAVLLGFALALPLFLTRAGRAALGHEPPEAARLAWKTGLLAAALGGLAAFLVPWRDLLEWISSTLSELTGVPVPPVSDQTP